MDRAQKISETVGWMRSTAPPPFGAETDRYVSDRWPELSADERAAVTIQALLESARQSYEFVANMNERRSRRHRFLLCALGLWAVAHLILALRSFI